MPENLRTPQWLMHSKAGQTGTPDQRQRGQSIVEFAFSLPFLLLIVLMVIEMGVVFSTYLAVVNGAREGAVFAAMYPQLADPACGRTPNSNCAGANDDMPYASASTSVANAVTIRP